jgi:uncharacterized protein (DUF2132 family)
MKDQLFLGKCYKFAGMEKQHSKDPLHGITLQKIVETLVEHYGFDTLGELIKIKSFNENPSVKSSLTFLRKTDWARKQVEELYIKTLPKIQSNN